MIAAPKKAPISFQGTKGNPRPQVIATRDSPMVESRHHSVSEAMTLANPSIKSNAPNVTGQDNARCRAQTTKLAPDDTTIAA